MSLLPSRPYKIRAIFTIKYVVGAGIFGIGALLLAVFGARWLWTDEVGGVLRDERLWNTGLIASGGNVSGQERSNQFILYSYDLKAEYLDVFGKPHRGECSFSMLWTSLDTSIPTSIRYNPDRPDEFVLSWAVEHTGARWGAVGLFGFGIAMFTFVLGALAYGLSRKLRDARRVAHQSDEFAIEIISRTEQIVNGTKTGAVIYRCRRPDSAEGKGEFEAVLAKGELPLYADAAQTRLLALIPPDPPRNVWIVRGDLYPFEFPSEEVLRIRERIQSRGSGRLA